MGRKLTGKWVENKFQSLIFQHICLLSIDFKYVKKKEKGKKKYNIYWLVRHNCENKIVRGIPRLPRHLDLKQFHNTNRRGIQLRKPIGSLSTLVKKINQGKVF